MIKKTTLGLIVIISLTYLGCDKGGNSLSIDNSVINPHSKIESINDSTFLGLISSIEYKDNLYHLTDLKNGRIITLDTEFKQVSLFGTKGQGPGEFIAPRGLYLEHEQFYVLDDGSTKINIFEMGGKFLGDIRTVLPTSTDFVVTRDSLLIGSRLEFDLKTPPVFKYKINDSTSVERFGSHNRILKGFNKNKPRDFFIKQIADRYILIGKDDPVIELYDSRFNQIGSFSYASYDYLSRYIQVKKERQINEVIGIDSFVIDCDVFGNSIYLLLAGYDSKLQKGESRHLLKLQLKDTTITPIKSFALNAQNDVWYYSFCISETSLLAFDAISYELHAFDINR